MEKLLLENPFLLLGLFLVFGYILSIIMNKIKVPTVVTYLISGAILANTLFRDVDLAIIMEDWFDISENLALGLIGFKIGTELKGKLLKTNRNFIIKVLFYEVFFTLFTVFAIIFLFTQDFLLALILGGLATATAPAATIEVLRKLRAKGTLTQRIQWILAFDDVLAVIIVEGIFVYLLISSGGTITIILFMKSLYHEIGLSLLIGGFIGLALDAIVERMDDDLEMMELSVAVIIASVGVAVYIGTSVVLTTMTIGGVATNKSGDNYERVQDLLEYIMAPIIMIFFVLVGARLTVGDLNPFPWIAIIYLIGRSFGKIVGAYYGSKKVCNNPVIQKNLGFGLLSQGGVALGLVAIAAEILTELGKAELGHQIISIVIISTIISEGLGAVTTEYAVRKAGEANKLENKNEHRSHFPPGLKQLTDLMYKNHREICSDGCNLCDIQEYFVNSEEVKKQ